MLPNQWNIGTIKITKLSQARDHVTISRNYVRDYNDYLPSCSSPDSSIGWQFASPSPFSSLYGWKGKLLIMFTPSSSLQSAQSGVDSVCQVNLNSQDKVNRIWNLAAIFDRTSCHIPRCSSSSSHTSSSVLRRLLTISFNNSLSESTCSSCDAAAMLYEVRLTLWHNILCQNNVTTLISRHFSRQAQHDSPYNTSIYVRLWELLPKFRQI